MGGSSGTLGIARATNPRGSWAWTLPAGGALEQPRSSAPGGGAAGLRAPAPAPARDRAGHSAPASGAQGEGTALRAGGLGAASTVAARGSAAAAAPGASAELRPQRGRKEPACPGRPWNEPTDRASRPRATRRPVPCIRATWALQTSSFTTVRNRRSLFRIFLRKQELKSFAQCWI
ncbi:PREDICTED: skin secretory protein xP2-like [Galeopterus variegatus]|uniref:Skin secretory protein xP2-like n=1 Tax=Galeopterus variegatus TaxID=482537 RepID=A0ABM0R1Q8_GALVR|nr:PREDICTED: skin secretory protein xP2-like [Galeopterus variegatus]